LNKLKFVLTAVTIAINVIPVIGIVLMYQGNLQDLVVPPEIVDMLTDVADSEDPLGDVSFVGSHYDAATRTVTLTFEVTNPLAYDLTVDSLSADVRCEAHGFPLGHLAIADPVSLRAGESVRVDVVGTWTEEAVEHIQAEHAGAQNIGIELVDASITVNGATIQTDELWKIPDFPVT